MFTARLRRPFAIATATAFVAAGLVACSTSNADETGDGATGLPVIAGFYPLQFAAERVGGDLVDVQTLTPAGAEPHDLELTPKQVAAIGEAEAVFYLAGFQPAVDAAVDQEASSTAVDVGEGLMTLTGHDDHEHEDGEDHSEDEAGGSADPHIWLDPTLMADIVQRVSDTLSAASPNDAATFEANAATLIAELEVLDSDWKSGTETCESRDLVVSHEAFGYLAARYDFNQVGVTGLSPEAEPSAQQIAEVTDFVRENNVRTIYFETLVDPKVAQTVADETGAGTAVLDPLEGLADGADGDYLSIMRTNLGVVQEGQACA